MVTRWKDLSRPRRGAVLTLGTVQALMAATAWADLARRPAAEVNGPKTFWTAIIAVNWIGPVAYFTKGRRRLA
jgi:hypothetical protein